MNFEVQPVSSNFVACDEIRIAPGEETNVFRGAFGLAFQSVCCEIGCRGAARCARAPECTYARFFEPRRVEGPSGYRDPPRPFVLRWAGPSGSSIICGMPFSIDLNLFDVRNAPFGELEEAFQELAQAGIGAGRGKAKFLSLDTKPVLRFSTRGKDGLGRVVLHFATPTELKGGGSVRPEPEFALLIQRLIERVWILGRLYQSWPGDWDTRDLLDTARMVRLVDCDFRHEHHQRRSSRTNQRHSISGFTGTATYEGPVGAFLPLLQIARWTGVGRQTVWGKGELRVRDVQFF